MKKLTWFESGALLDFGQIDAVEKKLNVKFPRDYVSVVSLHSGASNPDECEFDYLDKGRKRTGNFGVLLSLCDEQPDNLFEVIENLGDQLPHRIVPVTGTGSGDYVCLDYRKEESPSLVYFSHEKTGDDAIIPLTATFADLLERLRVPVDE